MKSICCVGQIGTNSHNTGKFGPAALQSDPFVCGSWTHLHARDFTDIKVKQVIELKKKVCTSENGYNFVVFNQKGIDPGSLDMLAKEGIILALTVGKAVEQ